MKDEEEAQLAERARMKAKEEEHARVKGEG